MKRTHSVGAICLALALTSTAGAADPGQQARLEREMAEAGTTFIAFCNRPEVCRYENVNRAFRPVVVSLGGELRPPAMPVVHLSPGSVNYRRIVGQAMYLYCVLGSRQQRLAEFLAASEKQAEDNAGGQASAFHWDPPKCDEEYEESFADDLLHLEQELDQARGGYGRACAWAWPYFNTRPMCRLPGFEPKVILNPLLPNPIIGLSETSPDYRAITAALGNYGEKIPNARLRQQDLAGDRLAAESAARWLSEAGLPLKPAAPGGSRQDRRLSRMLELYQQIAPALRRWRKDQSKIEALAEPYCTATNMLAMFEAAAQTMQMRIVALQNAPVDRPGDRERNLAEAVRLQAELAALLPEIVALRQQVKALEGQIREFQADQAERTGQTDAVMEEWISLCDVLGRLGFRAHDQGIALFNQCIAEEPRLWQLYLARGVALMHIGETDKANADLDRVEQKVGLYESRPAVKAFVISVRAYALAKMGNPKAAERRFAEAKTIDSRAWAPHYFRGWSNLERGKHSVARTDFQTAVRNCGKAPHPGPHEAMALLLAASPADSVRDGKKAVEHATKACDLTERQDWICLDTLAAAHAEAGDFESAVQIAGEALRLAPPRMQEPIRGRIACYRSRRPHRLEPEPPPGD